MKTAITTFIFDCFGVMCTHTWNPWIRDNGEEKHITDDEFSKVSQKYDLGIMSEDDVATYILKESGKHITKEKLREEVDGYLKLNLPLVDMIKKLKLKGFKIGLLTNINNSFMERKVYPSFPELKPLFDEIIISSVVQMVKPNEDIFLYTLEKLSSKPEECIFIDDSATNVDAGLRLGMKGLVYTDMASLETYIQQIGIDLDSE